MRERHTWFRSALSLASFFSPPLYPIRLGLAPGRWARLRGYALLALGLAALMGLEDVFNDGDSLRVAALEYPITFLCMFVGLAVGYPVVRAVLRRSADWAVTPPVRVAGEVTAVLGYSLAVAVPLGLFFQVAALSPEVDEGIAWTVTKSAIVSVIVHLLMYVVGKYMWLHEERDALRLLSARLEKESVELQYKALKSQVNPHFLFNSLNVLSALIYQDVAQADAYIKEFARMFRYVLEMNDEPVVTVRQELAFLRSYVFMQQIRFGASLRVELHVAAEALDALIPPLSLQLLAENALKHNTVSKAAPLTLHLTTDGAHLVLTNNYQPRLDTAPGASTGVGLRNLREKYRLISGTEPSFAISGAHYIARLPLIFAE